MLQFLKHLIQIIFSPARGWEDLERDCGADMHAVRTFFKGFLPFVAICSLSALMKVCYGTADWADALLQAAITFMTLFLASQVARFLLIMILPRMTDAPFDEAEHSDRWFILIMFPLAYLAIIVLMENLVKVHIAMLGFLPFYVVFIVWKGWRFACIPERNTGLFASAASVTVLGSYYILKFLLESLL